MNTSGKRYRVAQGGVVIHPNGETILKGGSLLEQGIFSEKWLESNLRSGHIVEDRNSQAPQEVVAADTMPGAVKNPPLTVGDNKDPDKAISVPAKKTTSPNTVTMSGAVGVNAPPQPRVPPALKEGESPVVKPENVGQVEVQETQGATTLGGDPAHPAGSPVGKWNVDPSKLAGMNLEQLNVIIKERDSSVEPFNTVQEATAWLSQDFVPGK